MCIAPSYALALLQALIAAWQICSSHGWSFHPPKNQTQVGDKKENIKVNPGGVGGGNSNLLGPKRLAKFFQNESSTKKGEYLMIWKYGWNHHPAGNGPTVLPGARLWSMNTRTSDSWSYDPRRYLITYPHYGPSFLAVLAGLNFQFLHTTFPTYNFVGFGDLLGFAKLKTLHYMGWLLFTRSPDNGWLYNPPRGWVTRVPHPGAQLINAHLK